LEGVVASETANNAATGGAMIPLLALGLPGGAITAMMVSVFMIHGMEPGPLIMLRAHDLVWELFVAMFLANLFIFFLGYLETKTVVNLLKIPFRLLCPIILILSTIGSYALRNSLFDVWVMILAGIAGYFLRRSGYSVAGIILGVILGKIGESAFVKAVIIVNYNWFGFFSRPVCAVLMVAGLLTLGWNIYRAFKKPLNA
jgi:putative tricarboxylic transport membrane protein